MPDSSNPQVPNFQPSVGRLVTDRYDFQAHVDGQGFNHEADQILLSPPVEIADVSYTDVQDAIVALRNIVEPPTIQLATANVPGIIQLTAGSDIGGSSALEIRVSGIRGYPISTNPPSINNVLTWSGSSWGPSPAQGVFSPGGDLAGNSSIQQVVGLSGSGGVVSASANNINFNSIVVAPSITQTYSNTSGQNMTIGAQGALISSYGSGGNLILLGGSGSASSDSHPTGGPLGGVYMSLGGNPFTADEGQYVFQLIDINGEVAAFFPANSTGLTSTDMPSNSGDQVLYIGNASFAPTQQSPTGAILWSQSGQLNIMQSNGQTFTIGSIPNPSVWNASSPASGVVAPTNGTITYNVNSQSTAGTAANAISILIPASSAVRMDMSFVGKVASTADVSEYNYSIGFVRATTGGPVAVGTTTVSDARTNGTGTTPGWTAPTNPTTTISGNYVVVQTGYAPSQSVNWTIVIQLIVATA